MSVVINGTTGITTPSLDNDGGTIDGTVIGGTTKAAGGFTTVTGTSDASINGLTVGRGAGNVSTNTVVGSSALAANTTGGQGAAFGVNALAANTTGIRNTGIGQLALFTNTTGQQNTAVGTYALYTNNGAYNVAVGEQAAYSNTTGSYLVAIGTSALAASTTGGSNSASGYQALYSNTTASNNAAHGVRSLFLTTTGGQNTAHGSYALSDNTTGTYNIGLGFNAQSTTATVSGECTLGDSNISNLRCNDTSISSLSDARDKTEIVDSPYGLAFINTVKPRQFKWQSRDGNAKDGRTHLGFIAQELLEATDGNNAVLNLVTTENPEKLEADYGKLLPIAIKAIQELSAKVAALEAQLNQGN